MNVSTEHRLDKRAVTCLRGLIQVNLDSRDRFRQAAQHIRDPAVRALFDSIASERDQQSAELEAFIVGTDKSVDSGKPRAMPFERTWMTLRAVLGGGDHGILYAAEEEEDHVKEAYEDALKTCAGNSLHEVLRRQYRAVKTTHDRVRVIRDSRRHRN